ncbi:hypothetical protein F0562_027953 [Nyssa sinensis]|uniref:Uncharacterized protein n=1 Tax=Nyssa sinensis TaxID=561372 RepID=A0A5J5B6M0_9ASTE|nr:hypothetical protein F0562_027953 [Nyssa sinensis]
MEIYDVKVGAEGELLGDVTEEAVGGEVEDGKVDEVLEVGGDWTGEGVKGEVEGLEVGAIGDVLSLSAKWRVLSSLCLRILSENRNADSSIFSLLQLIHKFLQV